jgi:hypothetical protein
MSTTTLKTERKGGFEIEIQPDPYASSPRETRNCLGTLYAPYPADYNLSDSEARGQSDAAKKHGGSATVKEFFDRLVRDAFTEEEIAARAERHHVDLDIPTWWESYVANSGEETEILKEMARERYVILSVHMHRHSGVTLNTSGFRSDWDSGQVGWIYVSYEKVREVYGDTSEETLQIVHDVLETEIDVYSTYVAGEAVRYVTTDPQTGETVDRGAGFINEDLCLQEARRQAEAIG